MDSQPQAAGIDQAAQLRRLIGDCTLALRQSGRLPAVDMAALTPDNAQALGELFRLAVASKRQSHSLSQAMDTLREGLVIFGPDLRVVYANRSFRAFLETAARVDVGTSFHKLVEAIVRHGLIAWDGTAPELADFMLSNLDQSQVANFASGANFRWYLKRDVHCNLVCIASDITLETQRERELEKARAGAEIVSKARTNFLAHMSHEFRTPMNGVIGMAELLCESGLSGERLRYAQTIRNSAEALLGLINEVLDYARGDIRNPDPIEQEFELEALMAEVTLLLMPKATKKGLTIRMQDEPLMGSAFVGDPGRVRQVLMNLVGNAIKYTLSGQVSITPAPHPHGVVLMVRDTGPGIPDEKIDMIFDEFSQLDESKAYGTASSGLGLAITRQLAASMGGQLWVSSMPGEGSCFAASLPLKAQDRPVLRLGGDDRVGMLMLHPDGGMRLYGKRHFTALGFSIRPVIDLDGALVQFRSGFRPRVVVLALSDGGPPPQQARKAIAAALPPGSFVSVLPVPATIPDQGTEGFDGVICLPIAHSGFGGAVTRVDATALPDSRKAKQRHMRVLAADDNATNRLVVEKMLRHCVIDLRMVQNGQEAVAAWRDWRPDLILMDISMPVLDGCEATRLIRDAEAARSDKPCSIVALTAHASDECRGELLACGVDDVLAKPVRRAVLTEVLVRYAPPQVKPPLPADVPLAMAAPVAPRSAGAAE